MITLPAGAIAKYCNDYVCLSVCVCVCLSLCEDISGTTRMIFQICCACCLWPWLGFPQAGDEIPRGRGSFGFFVSVDIDNALYSIGHKRVVGLQNAGEV